MSYKVDFVLELLNNLSDYVTTIKLEENAPIKENIKGALNEVKLHNQGKIKLKSAYDLLNEV